MRTKPLLSLCSASPSTEGHLCFHSPPFYAPAMSCDQPTAEKNHSKEVVCHQISVFPSQLSKILLTNEKHLVYSVITQTTSPEKTTPFGRGTVGISSQLLQCLCLVHHPHRFQRQVFIGMWLQLQEIESHKFQNRFNKTVAGINREKGLWRLLINDDLREIFDH